METTMFSKLPDDVVLKIVYKLEDDPRNWARLACVSPKFSSLIRNICWKNKCLHTFPSVVSDLLSSASSAPPGGWASLHKIAVCCPGLVHAGVLLENSDFGLERELGPDENYMRLDSSQPPEPENGPCSTRLEGHLEMDAPKPECAWSLYDDLYFDTIYSECEAPDGTQFVEEVKNDVVRVGGEFSVAKKRKVNRSMRSHLASGVWNLRREEGNKLLNSRFRGDSLYICDWPGCVHIEEKRNYMLFRGIFKDFKTSQVWRTIKDGSRSKIGVNCAFCFCDETWDLHSAFCLKRVFGYHDDGELVVRAYVCENGHVSGAWTDFPLYT